MKKTQLLLFALLFSCLGMQAQLSILLVDDSDDGFGHVEDFARAMDSLGYAYDLYDAAGTRTVPTVGDLTGHDLVIWHTGGDLDSLAFWSRTDTNNPALEAYMLGGGSLWLIGTDVLFDRYGGGGQVFNAGSFEREYLGLDSYDVQSYVDDGGLGMPFADPVANSLVPNLPQLDWIFSTLWYVDGVTPVGGGVYPLYEMGDTNYVLSGRTCGLMYGIGPNWSASFFFNLSQVSTFQKLKDVVDAMLFQFTTVLIGVEDEVGTGVTLYPNPASDAAKLRIESKSAVNAQLSIVSMTGQTVFEQAVELFPGQQEIALPISELPSGPYMMRLQMEDNAIQKTLIKR